MQASAERPGALPRLLSDGAAYTTKQDYVAALLRQAIVDGTIAPGQHLRQEDVAQQLGLSWTPVREAFRLLEAAGWLTIERHRGAIVSRLSLEDFEDIYGLRLINEPVAARLSAERMTGEVLARMQDLYDHMDALTRRGAVDLAELLRLEREFHRVQYAITGRPRLVEIVMSLRDAAERYLRASLVIDDEPVQHRRVHAEVLDACRARDGDLAERTMCQALGRVLTRMRAALARHPDGLSGAEGRESS